MHMQALCCDCDRFLCHLPTNVLSTFVYLSALPGKLHQLSRFHMQLLLFFAFNANLFVYAQALYLTVGSGRC